ncbi:MAG: hypothetical protein H6868_06685 [Rhodospirillales bacterium]|nr:hypothetical protein [Rhodospirillales bacterium]
MLERTKHFFLGTPKRKLATGTAAGIALLFGAEAFGHYRANKGQDSYLGSAWKATKNETLYWVGQAGIQMENAGKELRRTSWISRQEPK